MRPAALGLVAGLMLAACGSAGSSPAAVADARLLTGPDPNAITHIDSCSNGYVDGILIVDPQAGTAVIDPTIRTLRTPLMWPTGYRAHQAGAQLELTRPDGATFATTGNRYWIQGSFVGDLFYACGFVLPE